MNTIMEKNVELFILRLLPKDIFLIHFCIKDIKLNLEFIILLYQQNQSLLILIQGI